MVNLNQELGKIEVPQTMVDELGWARIIEKVKRSYVLMVRVQPNERIAWNLAINNVYSAWNGARTLLGGI